VVSGCASSGEKGANRHVTYQVQANRLLEERARGGYRGRPGWRTRLASRLHRLAQIPVGHRAEAGGVEVSDVSHGKRADVLHGGERSGDVSQLEEPT